VTGFREYTLFVKDLRTGELAPEKIPRVSSVAWAGDNKTVFYTVDDKAKRPYRLFRHVLATDAAADPRLYEEKDEKFTLEVSRSRSRAYVFVDASSHTSSEIRFVPANEPGSALRLIAPREKEREYEVDRVSGRSSCESTTPVAISGSSSRRRTTPGARTGRRSSPTGKTS